MSNEEAKNEAHIGGSESNAGLDLRINLCEIDNGRFADIIHALKINDACDKCDYFNPTIQDHNKRFRCHCLGSCIAATLHPNLQSYLWWKLGWIEESSHTENMMSNVELRGARTMNDEQETNHAFARSSSNAGLGSCGNFCEACARRDDKIKELQSVTKDMDAMYRAGKSRARDEAIVFAVVLYFIIVLIGKLTSA